MVLRGWLKQKTVDFFINEFPELLMSNRREKIGFYLLSSGLLERDQVEIILNDQKKNPMRFGSIAVRNKWIKPTTLDFFLKCFQCSNIIYLNPPNLSKDLKSGLNRKLSDNLSTLINSSFKNIFS